ncbi:substrate-binding domain-containing protein [Paraburkholderia caffeinilytica]|uniref:substrate-binding domain-containing protein n=1 Tax=Paraburkholderia caffeinilytica TaxID=1761016 RepID=UPI0038BC4672
MNSGTWLTLARIGRTSLSLGLALWGALAGISHAEAKDVSIGVLYLDSQGYYAGVRSGIQKAAAQSGVSARVLDSNSGGDLSKESSFIDSMIASKVSAIVVSATSVDGSVRAIRAASRAGIPVVCYNTCINQRGVDQYVYAYVVGDAYAFGQKLGDAAADYLLKAGVVHPRIGVLNCEFLEVCVQRRKGFEDALKRRIPDAQIVANQEGTILDKAISTAQAMLSAQPGINVLVGESGGATLGATKAVEKSGRTGSIAVFGCDMTTDIANELASGTVLKGIVDVSGVEVGRLAFAQAMDAAQGKKPASKIVPAAITAYTSPAAANTWRLAHADGLP